MTLLKALLPLLLLFLTGCITLTPIPMDTRVDNIGVVESRKLPLKVAIVVTDPPTHRIISGGLDGRTQDITAQFNESMLPLNRELSKASRDVFSQIFSSVTSLRQHPMPGSDYDLIITPKLKEVHFQTVNRTKFLVADLYVEQYYLWGLSILDDEGGEIFRREDRTPTREFKSAMSTETHLAILGRTLSEMMSDMAKTWGLMVFNSKEIREYLKENQ